MVTAPKKNSFPLLAGKFSRSTKQSTLQPHHANEGKSCLVAESVQALGALRTMRSKKLIAAEKRPEKHYLISEGKDK
jgi:hypothetical protein